jgi:hypothetical protein
MSEFKVYVLLLDGKHISPMEGASAYRTYEKACAALGGFILEDIESGRYYDDGDVEERLKAAIEAEEWGRMEEIHDAYWMNVQSGDRFAIHECPVE